MLVAVTSYGRKDRNQLVVRDRLQWTPVRFHSEKQKDAVVLVSSVHRDFVVNQDAGDPVWLVILFVHVVGGVPGGAWLA